MTQRLNKSVNKILQSYLNWYTHTQSIIDENTTPKQYRILAAFRHLHSVHIIVSIIVQSTLQRLLLKSSLWNTAKRRQDSHCTTMVALQRWRDWRGSALMKHLISTLSRKWKYFLLFNYFFSSWRNFADDGEQYKQSQALAFLTWRGGMHRLPMKMLKIW